MALYVDIIEHGWSALLQLGFVARIKSCHGSYLSVVETAGKQDKHSALGLRGERDPLDASIFAIFGDEKGRSCVLDVRSDRYISIDGKSCVVSNDPALLWIVYSGDQHFLRVSLQEPKKHGFVLSVNRRGEPFFVEHFWSWEKFQLQIVAGSVGNYQPEIWRSRLGWSVGHGLSQKIPATQDFIHPKAAFIDILIQSGVRCRLRFPHKLYLCQQRDLDDREKDIEGDVQSKPGVTDVIGDEGLYLSADEILSAPLTIFRRADGLCCLRLDNGQFVALTPLAADPDRFQFSTTKEESFLDIKAFNQGLVPCIAVVRRSNARLQYLSVSPQKQITYRNHFRYWEQFHLQPSLHAIKATMEDLQGRKDSKLIAADMINKEVQRRRIAQAVADKEMKQPGTPQPAKNKAAETNSKVASSKGGFDHSKALSALSVDEREAKSSHGEDATSSKPSVTGVASGSSKTASKEPKVNDDDSNIPRNKKNKKKNKKKGKAESDTQARATPSNVTASSSSGGGPSEAPSSSDDTSNSSSDSSANQGVASTDQMADGQGGKPCDACGRPLVGMYTKALGLSLHPKCFACFHCRKPMDSQMKNTFRTSGNKPYCDACYAAHVAPTCAKCRMPIMDTVTTAMQKQWHKDCLTCVQCKAPLTQTFYMYSHKPKELYCSYCWKGDLQTTTTPFMPRPQPVVSKAPDLSGNRARLMH